MRKEGGFAG